MGEIDVNSVSIRVTIFLNKAVLDLVMCNNTDLILEVKVKESLGNSDHGL